MAVLFQWEDIDQSTISATNRCIWATVRTLDGKGGANGARIEDDLKENAKYLRNLCI
jgi:catalase (peroxidase I)